MPSDSEHSNKKHNFVALIKNTLNLVHESTMVNNRSVKIFTGMLVS